MRKSLATGIIDAMGLVRAVLLPGSKYFHIWLGIEALVSSNHWSYDVDSEKITIFALAFTALEAMLANSKAEKIIKIDMIWQKMIVTSNGLNYAS